MDNWIDIIDYAKKYNVSQSTLRRRIRSRLIPFKLFKGKYFIQDASGAMDGAPLFARVAQSLALPNQNVSTRQMPVESIAHNNQTPDFLQLEHENKNLKAQVAELQTLIKALESELSGQA